MLEQNTEVLYEYNICWDAEDGLLGRKKDKRKWERRRKRSRMRKGKGGKEGEMMMKEQIHPLISSCVLVRFFCLFVLFCCCFFWDEQECCSCAFRVHTTMSAEHCFSLGFKGRWPFLHQDCILSHGMVSFMVLSRSRFFPSLCQPLGSLRPVRPRGGSAWSDWTEKSV